VVQNVNSASKLTTLCLNCKIGILFIAQSIGSPDTVGSSMDDCDSDERRPIAVTRVVVVDSVVFTTEV